jgi:hypothetical protein
VLHHVPQVSSQDLRMCVRHASWWGLDCYTKVEANKEMPTKEADGTVHCPWLAIKRDPFHIFIFSFFDREVLLSSESTAHRTLTYRFNPATAKLMHGSLPENPQKCLKEQMRSWPKAIRLWQQRWHRCRNKYVQRVVKNALKPDTISIAPFLRGVCRTFGSNHWCNFSVSITFSKLFTSSW